MRGWSCALALCLSFAGGCSAEESGTSRASNDPAAPLPTNLSERSEAAIEALEERRESHVVKMYLDYLPKSTRSIGRSSVSASRGMAVS